MILRGSNKSSFTELSRGLSRDRHRPQGGMRLGLGISPGLRPVRRRIPAVRGAHFVSGRSSNQLSFVNSILTFSNLNHRIRHPQACVVVRMR